VPKELGKLAPDLAKGCPRGNGARPAARVPGGVERGFNRPPLRRRPAQLRTCEGATALRALHPCGCGSGGKRPLRGPAAVGGSGGSGPLRGAKPGGGCGQKPGHRHHTGGAGPFGGVTGAGCHSAVAKRWVQGRKRGRRLFNKNTGLCQRRRRTYWV
jgi:hypothetical protein